MRDFTRNSEDMPEKLSRGNFLRNATLAVISSFVMLLVLTGCTKENVELIKGQLPGGNVGSGPANWYHLKATYKDRAGNSVTGYLRGENDWTGDPQWFYMVMGGSEGNSAKFQLHDADGGNGWQWWEMGDGYWLSVLSTGSAYRSGFGNRVAWKIINGKLYTQGWKDQALGAQWYSFLVSNGYYTSVNYGSEYELTNVQLELVK